MKTAKKLTALFLTMVMLLSLAGGVVAEEFDVTAHVNPFTGKAYTENSFYGNGTIIIILSHKESIVWREYTKADFPELELESVYTHDPMSDDKDFIERNHEYRNFVDITLKDKSNKAVIEAIELLYERCEDNYDVVDGDIYIAVPETKTMNEPITPIYPYIDPIEQRGSGDANCDNKVNLLDVTAMLQRIANWEGIICVPYYADMNSDDAITLADVTKLLQKLADWSIYS